LKHPRAIVAVLGLVAIAATAQHAATFGLADAKRAVMQGRVTDAISKLHALVAANPQDGQAHLLLCRTYYSERLADPAVQECEAALQTLNRNSGAQDWMGKVYGLKAEHAGPLTGFTLARKVKNAFETAVSLDPTNGEAIDDLGDYYLEAPAIVGGGTEKAKALADRSKGQDQTLRLQASIAEKDKDFASAERYFKEHIRVTHDRPDTWLDLAGFYKQQNKIDQAVDALHHAQAATHDRGSILVGIAEMLNEMQREPAIALSLLRVYLTGGNMDDSAPAFKAHVLLGKMLAARGEKAGAKIEFNTALALAPDYVPARKALASL